MDEHDQPTVLWSDGDDITDGRIPVPESPTRTLSATATPDGNATPPARGVSRRKLFGLAALGVAGVGVASATGALAFEKGWFHTPLQGSIASNAQIGHLLRRAGFGGSAPELATYATYGFEGVVDRLLNYQQVSDDTLENRLKALNLDLNKPQDQQRWWLLRMAWTQRPLLEKMTLFWHGVLTSSFRKVGGQAHMRMIVQNQFLRTHAFDTFDNILLGITSDPAML